MKNKKIIFIIIVVILSLTGVMVYVKFRNSIKGYNKKEKQNLMGIPVEDYNKIQSEENLNLIREKEEFINRVESGENQINELHVGKDEELQKRLDETEKEDEERNKRCLNIINRYYKDKFAKLSDEISSRGIQVINKEIKEDSAEAKMLNIIIDIIEKKDITLEEKELLINLLKEESSRYKYKEATKTKARIDKVCN